MNWPKCLVNIKQGLDRPVTVTLPGIWFSLEAFVIICNAHKLFILYYIMYFNSVIQWNHIIIIINWPILIASLKWSVVTHTRNLCSAFNPSKCTHTVSSEQTHTHSSEHTPGAVGSHLCCGARGAVGGSVSCSRAAQSWYWGWRERCTFTPPTYNSCWTWDSNRDLRVTSPTLNPLGHDCPSFI